MIGMKMESTICRIALLIISELIQEVPGLRRIGGYGYF